MKATTPF